MDGGRIISGAEDGAVRVWDVPTGAVVAGFEGGHERITCMAISPDGSSIASGLRDGRILVRGCADEGRLVVLHGHQSDVTSVAYSRDGRLLISGSGDSTVRVWDPVLGAELATARGHTKPVSSVAISADGILVVSGSEDTSIRLWETTTGAERSCLRGHESPVRSVAFSPNGKQIYSLGQLSIRLWELETEHPSSRVIASSYGVRSMAVEPGGRRLAIAGFRSIRLIDAVSGGEMCRIHGDEFWIECIAFSSDGQMLAFGTSKWVVKLCKAIGATEPARLRSHGTRISAIAFTPVGDSLVSRAEGGEICIWDTETGLERARIIDPPGTEHGVSVSSERRSVVFSRKTGVVNVREDTRVTNFSGMRGIGGRAESIRSIAVSDGFRHLALGTKYGSIYLYFPENEWACIRLRWGERKSIVGLAFSPCGRWLASIASDGIIKIWNLKNTPPHPIRALAGILLSYLLGEMTNACIILSPKVPRSISASSLSYSSDSRYLSARSNIGFIEIWDLASREQLIDWSPRVAGSSDHATVGGTEWRSSRETGQTTIWKTGAERLEIRFPEMLHHLAGHRAGRIWAGAWMNQLFILKFEFHVEIENDLH